MGEGGSGNLVQPDLDIPSRTVGVDSCVRIYILSTFTPLVPGWINPQQHLVCKGRKLKGPGVRSPAFSLTTFLLEIPNLFLLCCRHISQMSACIVEETSCDQKLMSRTTLPVSQLIFPHVFRSDFLSKRCMKENETQTVVTRLVTSKGRKSLSMFAWDLRGTQADTCCLPAPGPLVSFTIAL